VLERSWQAPYNIMGRSSVSTNLALLAIPVGLLQMTLLILVLDNYGHQSLVVSAFVPMIHVQPAPWTTSTHLNTQRKRHQQQQLHAASGDDEARQRVSVAASRWREIFASGVVVHAVVVDVDVALAVMRTVSFAHRNNFQSSGSIVVRRCCLHLVVNQKDASTSTSSIAALVSIAAGIACRLLSSPAVRWFVSPQSGSIQDNSSGETNETTWATSDLLQMYLPMSPEEVVCLAGGGGGGELTPGAIWARRVVVDDDVVHGDHQCLFFQPVAADDPSAIFVDPLYTKRGETPTTVVQWSKGTIF
jgi:hypothetical protein